MYGKKAERQRKEQEWSAAAEEAAEQAGEVCSCETREVEEQSICDPAPRVVRVIARFDPECPVHWARGRLLG